MRMAVVEETGGGDMKVSAETRVFSPPTMQPPTSKELHQIMQSLKCNYTMRGSSQAPLSSSGLEVKKFN
jgi:hypothetical protein